MKQTTQEELEKLMKTEEFATIAKENGMSKAAYQKKLWNV